MIVSDIVAKEIYRSPFISEALHAGIINISSLARYIQPAVSLSVGEKVSAAAIGMAIKRLPDVPSMHLDKSLSRFMSQLGDITVRSDLADYSYQNSSTLLQCQSGLLGYLREHKSYFYSFCKGVNETTIVCSEELRDKVNEIFSGEQIITSRVGLAAVSVNLPPTNLDTYGVYYIILKALAWKGINIVEVLSTSHEITLIISKQDVEQVFSIILGLKSGG